MQPPAPGTRRHPTSGTTSPPNPLSGAERGSSDEGPAGAIVPEGAGGGPGGAAGGPVRRGRWKLKPFELPRPVLLRQDGPLTLRDFLDRPDPSVLDDLNGLDE